VLKYQFETNVFGTHYLTCEAIKIMRKQGFGKIIQHSSVLGIISLKFRGAYNASKYALEGLNDTLRQELMGSNIYISTLNTGPVSSNFRKNALKNFQENIDINHSIFSSVYNKELKERLESQSDTTIFTITSQEAAKTVLKIVESKKPKPRYYITKATYILGFAKRILSTSLLDKLLNRI
jgi:short-subunit dehydrogenase